MNELLELYRGMLADQGVELTSDIKILEVGCGKGDLLYELNEMGYSAKGTDLGSYGYTVREDIRHLFSPILEEVYEFPYPDNSFDFVFSNQVVEHVQNLDVFFGQVNRVLRPGGISIHVFPSKYRIVEPHIKVPFGGIFTTKSYFKFWAALGVRYAGQEERGVEKVASDNYELISNRTNYITRAIFKVMLRTKFGQVKFIENSFLNHGYGRAAKYLSGVANIFPFVPNIYGVLHTNVLCLKK